MVTKGYEGWAIISVSELGRNLELVQRPFIGDYGLKEFGLIRWEGRGGLTRKILSG